MPSFFSRLKGKDGSSRLSKPKKSAHQAVSSQPLPKPIWEDAWMRKTVEPEEVQELLKGCTVELKARALDIPFFLLPFRPTSDPVAARTFIRNFFDKGQAFHGDYLAKELRLTEPIVLCSIVKWCWSRLPGGVVSWEAYELFREGEQDSNMARDSFTTFIPLSVDSDARTKIIFDFFELLSAIAAHGKTNGLGGRKLSRLAGWWAFDHGDDGNGFEGGYNKWITAADATSHLFFAYLRSLSPDSIKGINGISTLPLSLQKLVQETEYPPESPVLMMTQTSKVVMIVDSVSPTPFALLRRANHFHYRDDDRALQRFSDYDDPVEALTDECKRVLKAISSANQSQLSSSKDSTGIKDASWSQFQDTGFSSTLDETEKEGGDRVLPKRKGQQQGLRTSPRSRNLDMGRPTTPSWADFLSSGFVDEPVNSPAPLLLPPDKILPPIETTRGRSSQSHSPRIEVDRNLEPGELANIIKFELDDSFWWVWITSLAGEETAERKAAFGRCALIETMIPGGKWFVIEEMVKGAAPEPAEGAYVAEKKSRFGWTRRGKGMTRRKSTGKHTEESISSQNKPYKGSHGLGMSKTSIGPDQHARIQAAAAQLQLKQKQQEAEENRQNDTARRGRTEPEAYSIKTNSVFTLQPVIMSEAAQAMKWASKYDKDTIREAYLANSNTGRGLPGANMQANSNGNVEKSLPSPIASKPERSTPAEKLEAFLGQSQAIIVEQTTPPEVPPKAPMVEQGVSRPSQPREPSYLAEQKPLPTEQKPVPAQPSRIEKPSVQKQPEVLPRAPSADLPSSYHPPSPESPDKHNKLQKKAPSSAGFKKIFGRNRNRESKLPETIDGSQNDNDFLQPIGGTTVARRLSNLRKKSPPTESMDMPSPGPAPPAAPVTEVNTTPAQPPELRTNRKSSEPSLRESLSPIDSADAHEARNAFSRFDQGPLQDVPAFVEESPVESEEEVVTSKAEPDLTKAAAPVPNRWAQLKKNVAALQSEEQTSGQNGGAQNESELNGEETIESRVARIKARVAELTGTMESATAAPTRRS